MIAVGARVRIAKRDVLLPLAGVGSAHPRLGPGQVMSAGRVARVVGARRVADGRFEYELEDIPGTWPGAALETPDGTPLEPRL